MRTLTYGMNASVDGYVAAPGDDLGWSAPSDELFRTPAWSPHPVLVGGGTTLLTALDDWVHLNLVETRTFPDGVLLTRYEIRR